MRPIVDYKLLNDVLCQSDASDLEQKLAIKRLCGIASCGAKNFKRYVLLVIQVLLLYRTYT